MDEIKQRITERWKAAFTKYDPQALEDMEYLVALLEHHCLGIDRSQDWPMVMPF